jgi:two-component system chemotaxis response regulator CheY
MEMLMRAIVVDDSRTVRVVLRKILEEMGTDVVEAGDGQEALRQIGLYPDITLALVDWNMPVMNGLDFVLAVRARRDLDAVRIVMVTTETGVEQVARALRAGANEYVMKPFTKDILVAKLSLLDVFTD